MKKTIYNVLIVLSSMIAFNSCIEFPGPDVAEPTVNQNVYAYLIEAYEDFALLGAETDREGQAYFLVDTVPSLANARSYQAFYVDSIHGYEAEIMELEPGTGYFYQFVLLDYATGNTLKSQVNEFFTRERERMPQEIYMELYLDDHTAYVGWVLDCVCKASSGLDVTLEVVEGADLVEISGINIHCLHPGSVLFRATQDGNEYYLPAEPLYYELYIIEPERPLVPGDVVVDPWSPDGETNLEN